MRFGRRRDTWSGGAPTREPGRGAYLCSERCAVKVHKNKRYPGLAAAAAGISWGRLCPDEAGVYDNAVPPLAGVPR